MSEKELTTDTAIKYLESIIYEDFAPYTQKCLLKVIEAARKAEPVVHGRWIPHDRMTRSPLVKNYACSNCGVDGHRTNYCPNCGAKMKAGGQNE